MRRTATLFAAGLLVLAGFIPVSTAQIGGQNSRRGGPGAPETTAAARPTGPPAITDPSTVVLTVNVTGKDNASVTGLGKDRFQVFEDGVQQQVSYFWEDSSPITVGF